MFEKVVEIVNLELLGKVWRHFHAMRMYSAVYYNSNLFLCCHFLNLTYFAQELATCSEVFCIRLKIFLFYSMLLNDEWEIIPKCSRLVLISCLLLKRLVRRLKRKRLVSSLQVMRFTGIPFAAAVIGSLYFARKRLPPALHFGPKKWPFYVVVGIGALTTANLLSMSNCTERIQPHLNALWQKVYSRASGCGSAVYILPPCE